MSASATQDGQNKETLQW